MQAKLSTSDVFGECTLFVLVVVVGGGVACEEVGIAYSGVVCSSARTMNATHVWNFPSRLRVVPIFYPACALQPTHRSSGGMGYKPGSLRTTLYFPSEMFPCCLKLRSVCRTSILRRFPMQSCQPLFFSYATN